jgi:hypothetical protein
MWERFETEDFNQNGFALVPTNADNEYGGALFTGSLWENYDVSVFYFKVVHTF